jgi:hypothetical protein
MAKEKGGPHSDAGQDCPAQEPFEAPTEITVNGERLRIVQVTDEEGKAITQCLKERAESAPAGARIGRASAMLRAGVNFGAVVLLAVGVGVGLGDGNVFDDVGCSVAQQPDRASTDPGQTEEHPDGKAPGSDGGASGGKAESGNETDGNIEHSMNLADRQVRLRKAESGNPRPECYQENAETLKALLDGHQNGILKAILHQTDLIKGLVHGQEKLLAATAAEPRLGNQTVEPVSDNEAVRVFALMKALDDGQRNRKAPLGRVFRLLVLEGLSQIATAKQCGCSPGLVSSRVAEIQRRMNRPVTELRALASRLGEMGLAADDSRARKIYQRGLTDDTEEES